MQSIHSSARIAGILLASLLTTACLANNNYFLPGDVFFATELTLADIEGLIAAKPDKRRIEYVALDRQGGSLCGYAAHANAIIPTVDDAFARNLERFTTRSGMRIAFTLAGYLTDGMSSVKKR